MRLLQAFLLPAFNIPAALAANSTDVFYFMHISKAGGASFTDDLGARKHVGASAGYVSCGALHGARVDGRIVHDCRKYLLERPAIGCNFYACEGNHFNNLRLVSGSFAPAANVRTLLLVREPEAHIVSMYAHCQQDGATGQNLHHWPHIEFSAWVQLWAEGRADNASKYCGYSINNPQTCRLTLCNNSTSSTEVNTEIADGDHSWSWRNLQALEHAQRVVDEAHVVGVTSAYTASLCLALLRGPAQISWRELARLGCHCDHSPINGSLQAAEAGPSAHQTTYDDRSSNRSSTNARRLSSNKTHGTHSGLIGIDGATRDRIRSLTRLDELVYARALARLEKDVEALGWQCLLV